MLSRGEETEEGGKEGREVSSLRCFWTICHPAWRSYYFYGLARRSRATLQYGAFTYCINAWEQGHFIRALIHVRIERKSNYVIESESCVTLSI